MAWNTVVAGGGFAGLYAVRALERRLPRHSAKISIVSGVELPPLLAAAVDLADDRRVGAAERSGDLPRRLAAGDPARDLLALLETQAALRSPAGPRPYAAERSQVEAHRVLTEPEPAGPAT